VPWVRALLVGAILSPTDPVFASAIVGRDRVRHLLNVESGLNEGIALPFVIALIALAAGRGWSVKREIVEVVGGVVLGITVAAGAGPIRNLRVFAVARTHEPLLPFAVVILSIVVHSSTDVPVVQYFGGRLLHPRATC
jgi:NhaP-type Na+/H+ or K+/H+ antiporter